MLSPYLALIWDPHDVRQRSFARLLLQRFLENSPRWRAVVEQEGMIVSVAQSVESGLYRHYLLDDGQGIVIGKLFPTSYSSTDDGPAPAPAPVTINEPCARRIVATRGEELLRRYWGHYVAFLRNRHSIDRWVLRDPSGFVPCQWTRIQDIDVYFMRLEDCERLKPEAFCVNTHYLLGYLALQNSCVRETGLVGIETVLPGERIAHVGSRRIQEFAWNPLEIASHDVIEDPIVAKLMLRRTVRTCIHAWASCFDTIALQLSGGLDSSIVAACLKDAPLRPRVICRNSYSNHPGSDERRFARLVATRSGFELTEDEVETRFRLDPGATVPKTIGPMPWVNKDIEGARRDEMWMLSRGIKAIFAGHGGDELFYKNGALPSTVDHAWRHGIGRRTMTVALDDALLTRCSVWRVLSVAWRLGILRRDWHMRHQIDVHRLPLMPLELKRTAWKDLSLWHPLYRETAKIPPAKFAHAYMLTFGSHYCHVPTVGGAEIQSLSPLSSQPLLELSLRTPAYVLSSGGVDRSLARQSFAADLPAEVVFRRVKAFANAQYREIVAHNFSLVRELLLEGFLVQQGWLDRQRLEKVLSAGVTNIDSGIVEILDYLSVEAWIRHWQSPSVRVAA